MFADIVESKPPNPTVENVLTARTQTNATNLLRLNLYNVILQNWYYALLHYFAVL